MPWKKMLAWVTGQIEDSLCQKLEFVLEEDRVYRALLDRHSPVHGELPLKRRLAVQTIRGNGFANGNSQGRLAAVLGRPLSPRVCRPIALDAREPRYSSF